MTTGVEAQRLGFSLIHQPEAEDQCCSPSPHSVNIVFVHGLRGQPKGTWSYNAAVPSASLKPPKNKKEKRISFSKALQGLRFHRPVEKKPDTDDPQNSTMQQDKPLPKVFWPADLLPAKVPNARIWTYGYRADVFGGFFKQNNQNSVLKHANDFKRPIIIVSHSLGGLVAKRALSQMETEVDATYHHLLSRISAIAFCGCPHRGSDLAGWGRLARKLIAVSFADSNERLISDLEVDSETLESIQEEFLKTLHRKTTASKFRVHSFLEGRAVTGINGLNGKVVDDFSAKLGWANEVFETIDADHREMVKEPGVEDISNVLCDLESEFEKMGGESSISDPKLNQKTPYDPNTAYPDLHHFFTVDYQAMLSNVPKRSKNTCAWICETPQFNDWIKPRDSRVLPNPSLLWLHGYPGLGKSVIARYLAEEVFSSNRGESFPAGRKDETPLVVHFFCSYREAKSRSIKSLISSLIHQILYQVPQLGSAIQKRYETLSPHVLDSVWNLRGMLEDVLNELQNVDIYNPTVYVIVDALDELQRADWHQFCTLFVELRHLKKESSVELKFVVTSRREPEIERDLEDAWVGRLMSIDLSSNDYNASDVAKYLQTNVSAYGEENNFPEEVVTTIISEIRSRAGGMFLWASLAWAHFTGGVGTWTKAVLRKRIEDLRHLPLGMENLYYRILSTVDKRNQGELMRALQWIVAAGRPLSVNELSIALALRDRPRRMEDIDERINMVAFFRKTCPNLVKIDKGWVTLVHLSFKDYLLETVEIQNDREVVPNSYHMDIQEVNFNIGIDCLSYVVMDDFVNLGYREATMEQKFFEYALHWLRHLTGRNDRTDEIWVYFQRLIDKDTKLLRWYDTGATLLQLWQLNLYNLYRPAVEYGMDLNLANYLNDHLIHVVVPHLSMFPLADIQYLTGLGLSINGKTRNGRTLLHRCLEKWQLERGIRFLSEEDKQGLVFGSCPAEQTFNHLLAFPEIDLNAMDNSEHTPLSFATHRGLCRPVDILLESERLDIVEGTTPLHVAAAEGAVRFVEDLLKRDVDASQKTKYGDTALHLAAANGHLQVAQLLVTKCPQILNEKDDRGWTALHRSVASGNKNLVLWLMKQPGVNLNLKDKHGRCAVAFAASFGSKTILEAFLQQDPEQIFHIDSCGNTLRDLAYMGTNNQNLEYLSGMGLKGPSVAEEKEKLQCDRDYTWEERLVTALGEGGQEVEGVESEKTLQTSSEITEYTGRSQMLCLSKAFRFLESKNGLPISLTDLGRCSTQSAELSQQ